MIKKKKTLQTVSDNLWLHNKNELDPSKKEVSNYHAKSTVNSSCVIDCHFLQAKENEVNTIHFWNDIRTIKVIQPERHFKLVLTGQSFFIFTSQSCYYQVDKNLTEKVEERSKPLIYYKITKRTSLFPLEYLMPFSPFWLGDMAVIPPPLRKAFLIIKQGFLLYMRWPGDCPTEMDKSLLNKINLPFKRINETEF